MRREGGGKRSELALHCIYTHTYRAVFCRHDSAPNSDTTIPLNDIEESIWWLHFIGNDWKSSDISLLERKVQLCQLLIALGAKPGDKDSSDGVATLSLALGPCQT